MSSEKALAWPNPALRTCSCGKQHEPPKGMPPVWLGKGVLDHAAEYIAGTMGNGPFLVVSDTNTAGIAAKVSAKLAKLPHTQYTFPGPAEATDAAAQMLKEAIPSGIRGFIAVGSGSLTDVTRFVSFNLGLPFASIPTAPSMDGYLSWGAPLVVEGYKLTYPTQSPSAVITDLEVLATAPIQLSRAGFGDVLGKYTSIADWQLGHLLTGEYWCPAIVGSVENILDQCEGIADELATNPAAAAGSVIDALFVTGHAMICVGNSRPAAGAEHHMSHYWEMTALAEGRTHAYHGEQVGVACVLAAAVYQELLSRPQLVTSEAQWEVSRKFMADAQARAARVAKGFTASAGARVLNDNPHKQAEHFATMDMQAVNKWWERCREAVGKRMPSPQQLLATLRKAGAPATSKDLNLTPEQTRDAILYARELRAHLTILDVAAAAGILEIMAERLSKESFSW